MHKSIPLILATFSLVAGCQSPTQHSISYGECIDDFEVRDTLSGEGSFLVSRVGYGSIQLVSLECKSDKKRFDVRLMNDSADSAFDQILNDALNHELDYYIVSISFNGKITGETDVEYIDISNIGEYSFMPEAELSRFFLINEGADVIDRLPRKQ
ncbi:MAG: hypothetical protein ABJN65_01080 [Parasphingorhabdus sp.]